MRIKITSLCLALAFMLSLSGCFGGGTPAGTYAPESSAVSGEPSPRKDFSDWSSSGKASSGEADSDEDSSGGSTFGRDSSGEASSGRNSFSRSSSGENASDENASGRNPFSAGGSADAVSSPNPDGGLNGGQGADPTGDSAGADPSDDAPQTAPTSYSVNPPAGWHAMEIVSGQKLLNPNLPGAAITVTKIAGEGAGFESRTPDSAVKRLPEYAGVTVDGFTKFRYNGIPVIVFNFSGKRGNEDVCGNVFWVRLGDDVIAGVGTAPAGLLSDIVAAVSDTMYSMELA